MRIGRREVLIGTASAALLRPVRALARGGDADARLRAVLDNLGDGASPAAKLARLAGLSSDGLSPSASIDLQTVRDGLGVDVRIAAVLPQGQLGRSPYVVGPSSGAWREADRPDAAARIDEETRRLSEDLAAGVLLPQPYLDATIAAQRGAAVKASDAVGSAIARQADALTASRPRASADVGMWRLPHGDDYYALLVERHAGERVDVAALHERLIAKWRDLGKEADRLLRAQGLNDGSVGDRFVAYFRDPRGLYPDTSAGRDRAVADMNAVLDRARARIPALIGPAPAFCLDVRARRMSPADEAARRGGYRILPSATAPGGYFVDLADIARRPRWSLGSVVHHELLPGHLIQLPIEAAANPHPLRLVYAPAFAEGWGVYAEQLAAEDGAFAHDDAMRLGHIHWLLFRIGRAIVDTGIHYARWSLPKARKTLHETQGEPAYFAPFVTDIDRIALEPGIRAAEALNWLRLVDLRTKMGESGPYPTAFRGFHQLVLANGRKRLATIDAAIG